MASEQVIQKQAIQPNVVFILTDDQGAWAMGCAGNNEIITPNLDRMAGEGIRFTNFFCASPVCSPARASLLTGRIPSQHGVHDWIKGGNRGEHAIEYLAGQRAYTEVLAEQGYRCGLSGKWHAGNNAVPQKGFTDWYSHQFGGGPYYNAPMVRDGQEIAEPGYVTDNITSEALRLLDSYTQDGDGQPFYISVHYTAPHSPWGKEQHPEDIWNLYEGCAYESIPEEPLHPQQIDSAPHGTGERRKELLRGYFTATTAMDAGVGQILDKLQSLGLRENTLVIFSSDNGMNMGHHGIWGKGNGTFPQNMYDTSVKVPFLVSLPGTIAEGITCDEMVSGYDFMPTLLDFVGASYTHDQELPGTSFAGLLRGTAADRKLSGEGAGIGAGVSIATETGAGTGAGVGTATETGAGVEGSKLDKYVVVHNEYGPVRMIRTREWKYVHRYPYGPHELYHLTADPDERTNLINDPECQSKHEELKSRLEHWFIRYADPARDGRNEAVTGKGQLNLAGPAGNGAAAFADLEDRRGAF
jgi:choline-sulfatase